VRFDTSDSTFTEVATRWLRSLDDATLADTAAVFETSPGYYPTTLLPLRQQELQRRGLSSVTRLRLSAAVVSSLPVCHPADYEWRFSELTARRLLEIATSSLPAGELVAHVGTPTTFAVGAERFGDWNHVLLERSGAVIASLASHNCGRHKIIRIDLQMERPPLLRAAAAVVDPPWYPRNTAWFLAAACWVCRPSASILLCQPTVATRPGVREERETLLRTFPGLGLAYLETQSAALRYVTPHFETMSLRTALGGIEIPTDWRKGDLLLLRKASESAGQELSSDSDDPWLEVQFGPVRIKLRAAGHGDLTSLVPGDVLDTVSRRDPIRESIGMWTSGNRVYGLVQPATIGHLIELCNTDLMAGRFELVSAMKHASKLAIPATVARKLLDILTLELHEHQLVRVAVT
jgi:hypothetical protein